MQNQHGLENSLAAVQRENRNLKQSIESLLATQRNCYDEIGALNSTRERLEAELALFRKQKATVESSAPEGCSDSDEYDKENRISQRDSGSVDATGEKSCTGSSEPNDLFFDLIVQ